MFGGEEQRGPIRAGIFEIPEATVGDRTQAVNGSVSEAPLITSSALLSIGLVTILIVLNLVATGCVILSTVYSSAQRILQLALVWLLPLVGAILVLSVWAHDRKAYSRDSVRDDQEPWLPGIGAESDRGHYDGGFGDGAGHDGGGADGGSAGH